MPSEQIVTPGREEILHVVYSYLEKQCSQCGEIKAVDQFYKRRSECKKCTAIYRKRKGAADFREEGSKTCSMCKEIRDINLFGKDAWKPDGRKSVCKICNANAARNRSYKGVHFKRHLYAFFKDMTQKDVRAFYQKVYTEQQGLCALCGEPETAQSRQKVKRLAIDHCHKTGKFRGLLCYHCNAGLGHFRDNPQLLQNAILYLQKS